MSEALFQRNLAKCGKDILIQSRDIAPPDFDSPDFDETFSAGDPVRAIIKTLRGKTFFDGVSTDQLITHEFCIEYRPGITAEVWVEYDGRRFDVLQVENCCEANKRLILMCSERGIGEASKA